MSIERKSFSQPLIEIMAQFEQDHSLQTPHPAVESFDESSRVREECHAASQGLPSRPGPSCKANQECYSNERNQV